MTSQETYQLYRANRLYHMQNNEHFATAYKEQFQDQRFPRPDTPFVFKEETHLEIDTLRQRIREIDATEKVVLEENEFNYLMGYSASLKG
jgi:hypothetical protein